jgi:cyclically-permuted mutarotase family protein
MSPRARFPGVLQASSLARFAGQVRCGAFVVVLALSALAASTQVTDLAWDELPPLPPSAGQTKQPGVAGPFAGVHHDALIVAGGANFPEKAPWEGGAKVWWDDIWVLERASDGALRWVTDKHFRLPRPLGYGVSVNVPEGVVCAGGHNADGCYADVFLLSWDPHAREIRRTELPPMPRPLTFMAGALVGHTLYLAGGQHTMKGATASAVFWALDLSHLEQPMACHWIELPPWPGPARIVPVAATQHTSDGDAFFLFSGRAPQPGRATEIFSDAYAFTPGTRAWRRLTNVGGGSGVSVMAGTAAAAGEHEVLVFGGDRGELFRRLEQHDLAIEELRKKLTSDDAAARASTQRAIDEHLAAKKKLYETHPGFGREVLAYDVRRDAWRVVARAPLAPQVTTVAVPWGDATVFPSGEIKPGIRTPGVMRARVTSR